MRCLHGQTGRPDVLTNGDARGDTFQTHDAGGIAWREITLLVEHAVIGQLLLVLCGDDLAVPDDGSGVVQLSLVA